MFDSVLNALLKSTPHNRVGLRRTVGGAVKPPRGVWGEAPRVKSFAIFGHYSIPNGLKLIKLPAEKSNIGKISSNNTIHHLPLSKTKKRHINVA